MTPDTQAMCAIAFGLSLTAVLALLLWIAIQLDKDGMP